MSVCLSAVWQRRTWASKERTRRIIYFIPQPHGSLLFQKCHSICQLKGNTCVPSADGVKSGHNQRAEASDKQLLLVVAKRMGMEWRQAATHLGLSSTGLEDIQRKTWPCRSSTCWCSEGRAGGRGRPCCSPCGRTWRTWRTCPTRSSSCRVETVQVFSALKYQPNSNTAWSWDT